MKAKYSTVVAVITLARSLASSRASKTTPGSIRLGLVVSRNLYRRHLNESQRAMVAARLADLQRGANQHSEGLSIGRASDIIERQPALGSSCPRSPCARGSGTSGGGRVRATSPSQQRRAVP